MKRFEVWLADLNPPQGKEPGKVRPVVVVQSNLLNTAHPTTLVCPITSVVSEGAEFLRVHLAAGQAGLDRPSAILCDHIRAIDIRRLIKKLGSLPNETRPLLERNLQVVLDLHS